MMVHLPIMRRAVAGYEQLSNSEGDFWEGMEKLGEMFYPL
jgi:hypothetical protein